MGLTEILNEDARRRQTGDDWYVAERPYALELQTKEGSKVFVLPIGPESYEVRNVYRQSVRPTLGGTMAEERGILWREVRVSGTFGLQPKRGYDTTFGIEGPIDPTTALSGPMWTRRLIRNVLDKYAELKSDPQQAAFARLIWHDMKTDDHWVVVPTGSSVTRDNRRKMQYPYALELKVTGLADNIELPQSEATDVSPGDALAEVNSGAALIAAAIQEGSAMLGEVRYAATDMDGILTDMNTVLTSADDFVNGVTDTLSVGTTFVSSIITALDNAMSLMEDSATLLPDVRHNYAMAGDGLEQILATAGAFGTSYASLAAEVIKNENGATDPSRADSIADATAPQSAQEMANSNARSSDQALIDANALASGRGFPEYTSFSDYVVSAMDSLPSIAAAALGDGALWYVLAVVNGLQPPYVSPTGAPGTVGPGDVIAIPQAASATLGKTLTIGPDEDPITDLMGTDMRLREAIGAQVNAPLVDFTIDRRTNQDVQLISGYGNLAQALQMRVWTAKGAIPMIPRYGIPRTVGFGSTSSLATALRLDMRRTVLADPRVQAITRMIMETTDDVYEIDMDILPIGASAAQTVSTSLAGV